MAEAASVPTVALRGFAGVLHCVDGASPKRMTRPREALRRVSRIVECQSGLRLTTATALFFRFEVFQTNQRKKTKP